jgi:hypothetical protein
VYNYNDEVEEGHVAQRGEKRNVNTICITNQEEIKPLGRTSWWIILKWILDMMGWYDWIDLIQDMIRWRAFVHTVMNLRVP